MSAIQIIAQMVVAETWHGLSCIIITSILFLLLTYQSPEHVDVSRSIMI